MKSENIKDNSGKMNSENINEDSVHIKSENLNKNSGSMNSENINEDSFHIKSENNNENSGSINSININENSVHIKSENINDNSDNMDSGNINGNSVNIKSEFNNNSGIMSSENINVNSFTINEIGEAVRSGTMDAQKILEETGVLFEVNEPVQRYLIVGEIVRRRDLIWESLLDSWRTSGLDSLPSNPWEARLFAKHRRNRVCLCFHRFRGLSFDQIPLYR